MKPLRRAIIGLSAVCFAAGLAAGFTVCEVLAGSTEEGSADPTDDFVRRMTREFDLDTDQQRLIKMIDVQRRAQLDEFWRSQTLSEESEEDRQRIAARAKERILEVLSDPQRARYLAQPQLEKN